MEKAGGVLLVEGVLDLLFGTPGKDRRAASTTWEHAFQWESSRGCYGKPAGKHNYRATECRILMICLSLNYRLEYEG